MALSDEATRKIRQEVLKWSVQHPIDFLWREHFQVPFGSEQHLKATFIEQCRWFEERELFEIIREEKDLRKGIDRYMSENDMVNKNSGVIMTEKKIDDKFENLDLSKFEDEKK